MRSYRRPAGFGVGRFARVELRNTVELGRLDPLARTALLSPGDSDAGGHEAARVAVLDR